jgi:hypothetical protein
MDNNLAYLSYVPPKSNSHGHYVRSKDHRLGLIKTIDTFKECFGASQFGNTTVTLHHDNKIDNQLSIDNTISKLNSILGKPIGTWENTGFPNIKNTVTWSISDKSILELEEFYRLNSTGLLPLENISIYTPYAYGTKDTPHGTILCCIQLGKLFVSTILIFPYSIDNPELFPFVSKVYKQLPFKLSNKHFKHLVPSKKGHRLLKPDETLQKQIDECLK